MGDGDCDCLYNIVPDLVAPASMQGQLKGSTHVALINAGAIAQMFSDPVQRNVLILAICQALGSTGMSMLAAVASLVGYALVDDKSLATLPVAVQWTATMITTIPASHLMRWIGRRAGLSVGVLVQMSGGLVGCYAIVQANFGVFLLASVFVGIGTSFIQYYRFAAVDAVPESFRGKAISLVLAGGVVAAVLGGELAKWSFDWFLPYVYAGCYIAMACLCLVVLIALQGVRIPRLSAQQRASSGRPLWAIAKQPVFIVAVLAGALSYGSMVLVMTATPLAMGASGFVFTDSATVIQWHVLAMYAPSFFTGSLIQRFGVLTIILCGTVLMLTALVVGLSGIAFMNFWGCLFLVGLGWNFMFVGGSTLLTSAYTIEERAKVQAANDFTVFSVTALSAFGSGALLTRLGWDGVTSGVAPAMGLALIAVLWLMALQRRQAGQPQAGAS
ncbi:MAG: MFS family permease [Gammaproteobacteria bacterium]